MTGGRQKQDFDEQIAGEEQRTKCITALLQTLPSCDVVESRLNQALRECGIHIPISQLIGRSIMVLLSVETSTGHHDYDDLLVCIGKIVGVQEIAPSNGLRYLFREGFKLLTDILSPRGKGHISFDIYPGEPGVGYNPECVYPAAVRYKVL